MNVYNTEILKSMFVERPGLVDHGNHTGGRVGA